MRLVFMKMMLANLGRQPRRTAITLGGIAVGVACAYLFLGFIQESYFGLSERFARSGNGHIQIARAEWFGASRPEDFRYPVSRFREVAAKLEADPEVSAVSLRRKISGLISTGERTEVFVGQGVDPLANTRLSTWVELVAGNDLSPLDKSGVLVGKLLAEKLGVKPGDNASLLVSTDDGRTNAGDVRIAGILQSVSRDADAVALILPVDTALQLLQSDKADALFVGLHDTARTQAVLSRARAMLGDGLEAKGWMEVAEFYQSVKSLYGRIFGFVEVILFLVTLMAVANTVVMAVM
jgi:putative ABC transport system permease protein